MRFREGLSQIWHNMNPKEPSGTFLLKFMAFAVGAFGIALVIGQITAQG